MGYTDTGKHVPWETGKLRYAYIFITRKIREYNEEQPHECQSVNFSELSYIVKSYHIKIM